MSTEETGGVGVAASPMLAGTFAVYTDDRGGFVLVTETEQHGVIRKRIPAAIVKLTAGRFGQMFGGGNDGLDEHPTR